MIYVALAVALVLGFCFGPLTRALVAASKRQPAGSAPRTRRLFLGESPTNNLNNALQLLRSVAFARGELGDNATDMVTAAMKRIEAAIKQLEREAA